MAFNRPTLEQIIDRVRSDIRSELSITTILRRSFLGAISRAIAGATHILHGHLVFISRQIFPDQAEDEFLIRWGAIYGLDRRASTFTQVTISGTGTDGVAILAGTSYQIPSGETFTTDVGVTIAGGMFSVAITSDNPGSQTNLEVGEGVNIAAPIAGVDATAEVSSVILEGADEETVAAYRERVVARIQEPPSGGTAQDYIGFALTVPGVTRAFVFPGYLGPGTVGLTFFQDNDNPIIPSQAKVDEVQAAVDALKPITAQLVTFIPQTLTVDLDIAIRPNTPEVQAAILTELEDLFFREARPTGAFSSVGNVFDGRIPLSQINEAISVADGEEDHVLLTPSADIQPANGFTAQLGTITWQTLS